MRGICTSYIGQKRSFKNMEKLKKQTLERVSLAAALAVGWSALLCQYIRIWVADNIGINEFYDIIFIFIEFRV